MADTVRKPDRKEKPGFKPPRKEGPLKGMLIPVVVLGGFLAIAWLLIFILFVLRNS